MTNLRPHLLLALELALVGNIFLDPPVTPPHFPALELAAIVLPPTSDEPGHLPQSPFAMTFSTIAASGSTVHRQPPW